MLGLVKVSRKRKNNQISKFSFVEFVVDAQSKTAQVYLTLFSELLCSWRFLFLKNAGMVGHF